MSDWMCDKYKDVLEGITTLKPFLPDKSGYTKRFQCVKCEQVISLPYEDQECNYLYCPYCGREIV